MSLHIVAFQGNLDEVKRQIEKDGANPSQTDIEGYPSHYAACGGHVDVLEYLVHTCGVDLENERAASSGYTPLLVAAARNQYDCVKWMLGVPAVDVNAVGGDGVTPLIVAAINGHMETATLLADDPRCGLEAKDKHENLTAFVWAVRKGHWDIAAMLLEHGADPRGVVRIGTSYYSSQHPPPPTFRALLQTALAEPARVRILCKARVLADGAYAARLEPVLSQALPSLPGWYKKRVLADLPLPRLEVRAYYPASATTEPGAKCDNSTFDGVLGMVLGTVPYGPVLADHLVAELMDYMAPTWVPERRR